MEWSKIKNIIILILLTVNVLLLGLLIYRDSTSRAQNTELLTSAVTILSNNGVHLSQDLVPRDTSLTAVSMERDLAQEAALAESLLGPCQSESSGATYTYVSTSGSAVFRSTGDFAVTYSAQGSPVSDVAPAEHALALLELVGLSCQLVEQEQSGSQTQVVLCQLWDDVPVFTCQITLIYEQQALQSIQGRRVLAGQGQSLDQSTLAAPTVLVRFLSAIIATGEVCNEITRIEPGYQMTVSLTEPITLRPIWRLTTDTGRFDIDLATGDTARIS
jgi:hypothetical protein